MAAFIRSMALASLLCAVSACGSHEVDPDETSEVVPTDAYATADDGTDTDAASASGIGAPTYGHPYSPPQTFHGNDCTDDCSGHEAGYQWAEDNGITDPDDCGGNSPSFIEGCESYAEEQQSSDNHAEE